MVSLPTLIRASSVDNKGNDTEPTPPTPRLAELLVFFRV